MTKPKFFKLKNTFNLGECPTYAIEDWEMIEEFLSIDNYYEVTGEVMYHKGYLFISAHDYDWIRSVYLDSNKIEFTYVDSEGYDFEVTLPRTLQGARTAKKLFKMLEPSLLAV